jgi:magnesium chelatase family protein
MQLCSAKVTISVWLAWGYTKQCTSAESTVTKYPKRISGPLLDRIDIHIEVPRVDYQKLSSDQLGESSEAIRERVEAARPRQCERFS